MAKVRDGCVYGTPDVRLAQRVVRCDKAVPAHRRKISGCTDSVPQRISELVITMPACSMPPGAMSNSTRAS